MKRIRTTRPNEGLASIVAGGIGVAALVVAGVLTLSTVAAAAGTITTRNTATLASPTLRTETGGTTSSVVERVAPAPKPRQTTMYSYTCPAGYHLQGGVSASVVLSAPRTVLCER